MENGTHAMTSACGFATKAIHTGQEPEPNFGAVVQPIFMTSTYAQEYPGSYKGYDYTRAGNPSFTVLEKQLAALEGGKFSVIFSAGLAGVTALMGDCKPGDCVVAINSVYGGTYRLLKDVMEPKGVKLVAVLVKDVASVEKVLQESKAKFFFFESPTNPLMEVLDIAELAAAARRQGVMSVCDNTFATPYHQSPLALGVDVVLHSCTKYIGGHSDVVGGCIVTNLDEVRARCEYHRKCQGLNPSPFDAWLVCRSLKTLAVRMERHSANAMAVAKFLQGHALVSKVNYPGLPEHPNHDLAKKQMHGGFSGMLSVEFALDLEATKQVTSNFKIFTLAESLGGVESLVCHPASMTHACIPREVRQKMGFEDGLVRLSVGIEDEADLIEDIKTALSAVKK